MTNKEFDAIFNHQLQTYTGSVPAELWNKIAANDLSGPKNGFDDYIKDKLYNHEAAVPTHFWERVKPKEEDKRRFAFWIPKKYGAAAALLLLVLAGSVAAYLYSNRIQLPNPTHIESALPILTNDSIQEKNEPMVVDKAPMEPNNHKGSAFAKKTNAEENKTNWKLNKKNITQSFKQKSSVFPFDQIMMNKNEVIASKNQPQKDNMDVNDLADSIAVYELTEKAGDAYIKQRRNLSALYNRELNKYNHALSFKNVVICPTDRKIRNPDWDLEVYTSPDMPFKFITNNTASPQLLSRKDSSESLRPGFSAGFRIVKPLTDNFSIKVGLQYSQINERFTYRTENQTRTTTVVTIRSIIRAPGDTLMVRDTSTLTQIGYKTNTVKNRFRSIDIPLLVSYQVGSEDLKFGITTGLIVNLSSWYQGVILDSSLLAIPLNKETNMVYKSNIGLGLYAGFNVTKRINYATQLFFEPYLRYNISNMTNPEAAFNQRFSIGGVAMGLRLNLNKR